MDWISILSFGVLFLLIISLFRKETDVFSPARLFAIIWTFAIGLTELKFSRYQYQWSGFSWMMLLISLFSMLTGMFIVYVINLDRPMNKIISIRDTFKKSTFNSALLLRYTVMLFASYIISYIISVLIIGYVPFFSKFPGVARNDWGIFGFGLFVQSFPSIIYLGVLYFIITKGERGKKALLLGLLFIAFMTYAFLLQRYYIVFAILIIAVSVYYLTNLLRFKNVVIFLAVIFLSVFTMTFIRLTGTIANYLYYLSDMRYSVRYAVFTEPYMYIVMNLENFANAVEKIQKFTYGTFSFDFIFALSGLKHSLAEYMSLPQYPNLLSNNFNTYTMFFIYYWDFGVIGLGAVPLLLGAFIANAYYKMRRIPSINTVSVYSVFAFVLLFSFFVPIISFLHFAFNFFIIYYVTKKVSFG